MTALCTTISFYSPVFMTVSILVNKLDISCVVRLLEPDVLQESMGRVIFVVIRQFNSNKFHESFLSILAFFQDFKGAKSIVMQISFVMLIFLLFRTKFHGGGGKSLQGELLPQGAPLSPLWKKASVDDVLRHRM